MLGRRLVRSVIAVLGGEVAAAVLQDAGWSVHEIWWKPPRRLTGSQAQGRWVQNCARKVPRDAGGATSLIAVKSFGTPAAPVAAVLGLPGIWLTPLLRDRHVVDALTRTTAPCLLVGGTADETWHGDLAAAPRKEIIELPCADHSARLTGDVLGSVDLLRQVVERVTAFVHGLGGESGRRQQVPPPAPQTRAGPRGRAVLRRRSHGGFAISPPP